MGRPSGGYGGGPRARRGDAGQASGEYIIGILLLAGMVSAFLATGIGGYITGSIDTGVCKVLEAAGLADDCTAPEPPTAPDGRIPHDRYCFADQVTNESSFERQLIVYSGESRERFTESEMADGKIWVSVGGDERNGFGGGVGIGFKLAGKGAEVSLTGGYRWMAEDKTTFVFEDAQQRDEFYRRVEDAGGDLAAVDGNPEEDDGDPEKEIPYAIADDMGILYMRYYGEGNDAYGSLSGTYGVGTAEITPSEENTAGTEVWSDGTTVQHYRSSTFVDARGGANVGLAEIAGSGFDDDSTIISVYYDENGNPQRARILSESSWDAGGSVSLGRTWKQDKRSGGTAGKWTPWRDHTSDSSIQMTFIPLEGDPEAQDVVDRLINPPAPFSDDFEGEMQRLTEDLGDTIERSGSVSVRDYDRTRSREELDVGGSYIIKIAGVKVVEEEIRMELEDAYYLDPRTGERVPWPECDPDE